MESDTTERKRRKTEEICVRLNVAEYDTLWKAAMIKGVTVSEMVRIMIRKLRGEMEEAEE